MIIKNFPNNADEYIGAEQVMKWLHGRTSGVYPGENNAAVSAIEGQMAVKVSDGIGWMSDSNGNGCAWWSDAEAGGEPLILPIDAAASSTGRIDRIIVQWDTTQYVNKPEIIVLKGTQASTPTAPELTNNGTIRQISLAQVLVPRGTLSLMPTNIIDERADPAVCGYVTDNINIDTSTAYAQYLSAVKQLRDAIGEAWAGAISDGAVTSSKIADNAITIGKLASGMVLSNEEISASDNLFGKLPSAAALKDRIFAVNASIQLSGGVGVYHDSRIKETSFCTAVRVTASAGSSVYVVGATCADGVVTIATSNANSSATIVCTIIVVNM